ncbi:hypothetical protein ACJX0J_011263, partial [Zea mays]
MHHACSPPAGTERALERLDCSSAGAGHGVGPPSSTEKLCRSEGAEVSYGLKWAIAGKCVIAKDKVFHNLEISEIQKGDYLSGIPLHVRGDVIGGVPGDSKAQFAKLLKLVGSASSLNGMVMFHLSSISCIYVQDGAIGSSAEWDAKVRGISDNPSAVMLLSNVLWKIPDRAISHDTSPLTIYATSSIRILDF